MTSKSSEHLTPVKLFASLPAKVRIAVLTGLVGALGLQTVSPAPNSYAASAGDCHGARGDTSATKVRAQPGLVTTESQPTPVPAVPLQAAVEVGIQPRLTDDRRTLVLLDEVREPEWRQPEVIVGT